MKTFASLIALIGAIATVTVSAHHGKDGFAETPITLQGTVIDAAWQNPHVLVTLEVEAADGSAKRWTIDLSPPNALRRGGFTADALKAGAVVTVNGYPTADRTRLTIRTVTFPDGRTHTSSNEFFAPGTKSTLTFKPGTR